MNSQFLQPKNALQRAEELRSVGQDTEAFETLHRCVCDRRFRYLQWDAPQQLEVVIQYVHLAVELDQIKIAREGLLGYRNHCQHNTAQLGPFAKVLYELRTAAEAKLDAAGCDTSSEEISDIAAALLNVSVSPASEVVSEAGKQHRDAQKLVLEVYKTILDLIKTTPKVQKMYHETAHKAFNFCAKYQLRSEFKRLCEIIRNHHTYISRHRPKSDADEASKNDIDELKRPELHIETRLSQLKNAASLELWKEAMQTMEDLYSLGVIDLAAKRAGPKLKTQSAVQVRQLLLMSLAAYYEKLSEVFGRSGFRHLHGLSFMRWIHHIHQHNKTLTADEYSVYVSLVTLAVLSVPLCSSDVRFEEEKRLTVLLGQPSVPTRAYLISLVRDRILPSVLPPVAELFHMLESEEFVPFTAVSRATALFEHIRECFVKADATSAKNIWDCGSLAVRADSYIKQLEEVLFDRLVTSLARVYSTVSIEHFREKICPESFMPWHRAERAMVHLAAESKQTLKIRVDYVEGVVHLGDEESESELSDRLATLYSSLGDVIGRAECKQAEQSLAAIRKWASEEESKHSQRLAQLDRKRVELDSMKRRRDENLEELARDRALKEAEAERVKLRSLELQRQQVKTQEEIEAARLECAKQLLTRMQALMKELPGASANSFMINDTPLSAWTPESVISRHLSYKDFEVSLEDYVKRMRLDTVHKKKLEHKRVDHWARAIRMEEAQQIDAWAEAVKVEDQKLRDELIEVRLAARDTVAKRREAVLAVLPAIERWAEAQEESPEDEE